jgi:general secretion pathway protein D
VIACLLREAEPSEIEGTRSNWSPTRALFRVRIKRMQRAFFILAAAVLVAFSAFAGADGPSGASPPVLCASGLPGGTNCVVSKKDLKQARVSFQRALKLESGHHLEEAFAQFDEALRLVPRDAQFLTHRELVKAQLVFNLMEHGNALLAAGQPAPAVAEFKRALELDSGNPFAQQRLAEALQQSAPPSAPVIPATWADMSEIHLEPKDDRATFHYRGDVRGLFGELASAYGVTATFDDSVTPRPVRFFVDDVDFFTALRLACEVSKTMWSALDAHQLLVAADSAENHKQFDRMSLGRFTLPAHTTPQEATEIVTVMRNMFDLHFVSSGQTTATVEVRAPQAVTGALTRLMEQLNTERPQVMLDLTVYEISHNLARNIGLHIPDQFNLFNIPAGALAALGGQNIQQLINQLISSGGINQANSTSLSALLAQLGSQQSSIFSQPLATFGGGLTLMGLSLDQLAFQLSVNESWAQSLDHLTLRTAQGNEATFHLGTRYPIVNATYAPIFNSSAISKVLGNQSYIAPVPSVYYEDLGLNFKAKPTIHGNGDVSMELNLQVRSLTGNSTNGQPIISNREYKGSINLKDGEPAAVAGQVSLTEQRSLSGIPGLGQIPGLNQVMVSNSKSEQNDELLIVITPHVLSNTTRSTEEIWITAK